MNQPPRFSTFSHCRTEDDQSCAATWEYEWLGKTVSLVQEFQSFEEAHNVNEVVRRAHELGQKAGEDRVKQALYRVLDDGE